MSSTATNRISKTPAQILLLPASAEKAEQGRASRRTVQTHRNHEERQRKADREPRQSAGTAVISHKDTINDIVNRRDQQGDCRRYGVAYNHREKFSVFKVFRMIHILFSFHYY